MANDKKQPLTEMQEAFLQALVGEANGDIRTAMRAAGYSDNTRFHDVLVPLKEEIIERTMLVLAANAPKAALGLVGVLNDPSAMGARNSVAAASQVLDRVGIVKKEQIEVKGEGSTMFILPPKSAPIDDETDTE
jgi:hypothetical protein